MRVFHAVNSERMCTREIVSVVFCMCECFYAGNGGGGFTRIHGPSQT